MPKDVVIETPALIHIGAQKTASTWLHKALRQHDAFQFSPLKEVHFFTQVAGGEASDYLVGRVTERVDLALENSRRLAFYKRAYLRQLGDTARVGSDAWYRDLFLKNPVIRSRLRRGLDTVLCDFTPHYMTMGREGFEHIRRLLPNAHAMLVIRDPVRRMVSGFSMTINRKPELASATARQRIEWLESSQPPRGDYRHALEQLDATGIPYSVFAFRDLVGDPASVVQLLENTFGLDHQSIDFSRVPKANSHSGRQPIEPELMERIEAICAPQYAYLRARFGEAFLDRI
ncbi:sulfotransferase [Marinihelvus fidelis]|uniref:Sulfotransferase n=1 Tax=Marinihelvus fidelis TaxID=2613842 RepID=A0A5N0TFY0_9GAMM|nr:sulfotransferase [Marinihelvus fidelis]KAA9133394.1 sulfotransferase [Marinihelvus fidelis]